jgi:hypothetical protein
LCPACQAPFRDIEVAHIDGQRQLSASSDIPFTHRLALFCGHKVEVTVRKDTVDMKVIG